VTEAGTGGPLVGVGGSSVVAEPDTATVVVVAPA
jgi:hypothetical protein